MEINCGSFTPVNIDLSNGMHGVFKRSWSRTETKGVRMMLSDILLKNLYLNETDPDVFFASAMITSEYLNGMQYCCTAHNHTIDGYELQSFLIRNDGELIAYCMDEEENDIFFICN